jgi:hypothetical protein
VVALAVLRPLHCLSKSQNAFQVGFEDESLSESDGVEFSHTIICRSILFLLDILKDDDFTEVIGFLPHHCLADEKVEQLVASL